MKHAEIIAKMTVEEKAAILSGVSEWESREIKRLGIPAAFFRWSSWSEETGRRRRPSRIECICSGYLFSDGSYDCKQLDESLGEEIGKALGEEASALGVDVLLGPGLNIKRSLCVEGILSIFLKILIWRERWLHLM